MASAASAGHEARVETNGRLVGRLRGLVGALSLPRAAEEELELGVARELEHRAREARLPLVEVGPRPHVGLARLEHGRVARHEHVPMLERVLERSLRARRVVLRRVWIASWRCAAANVGSSSTALRSVVRALPVAPSCQSRIASL